MRRRTAGFTLLELLLVLVVVGVLTSLGVSSYIGAQRNAQLREATAQFAADLQRARSAAQRYNQDASLIVGGDASSYTLVVDAQVSERQLPHDAQVEITKGNATLTYRAPFGEINATDRSYLISSPRTDSAEVVRVLGVTGKVIVK